MGLVDPDAHTDSVKEGITFVFYQHPRLRIVPVICSTLTKTFGLLVPNIFNAFRVKMR